MAKNRAECSQQRKKSVVSTLSWLGEKQSMEKIGNLAQRLAACRNFTEISQLATTFPLTNVQFSGALIASLDADARIRELGRYGVMGEGPSKEAVALSSKGLVAKSMQGQSPVLLNNLLEDAKNKMITPESDIDQLVTLNGFEAAYVIPLYDQEYLYGVLGLLSPTKLKDKPVFEMDENAFQALFSMAVRAVAYRNPERTNKEEVQLADLTMREQTILALLAQDKTNQEIAQELSISVSTAKAAVSEILKKLKVDSRKQAGIKARYSGLA
jgi:DNA-binding CsgD family transcriptional regulator